jgi:hypothetical protein
LHLNRGFLILLLATLAAFIYGVLQLIELRYETGDVYPAYSSLRSDPMGAEVFYDSLEEMPGIKVSRNLDPLEKLESLRNTTLFSLGENSEGLNLVPEEELKKAEGMAASGGRLVIAFVPLNRSNHLSSHVLPFAPPGSDEKSKKEKKDEQTKKESEAMGIKLVSLKEAWGVTPSHQYQAASSDVVYAQRQSGTDIVRWRTSLWFDELDSAWRSIYSVGPRAVVIERRFGAGTIVLCSDSYCLSNEAMLKDRAPELLSWLVGPNDRVIFDETHLGVESTPNIASLARKYRLHGAIAAVMLLVGLFIWKNSSSLVPARESGDEDPTARQIAERDMTLGLENLLRRNIPRAEVLSVCFTEWKKTKGHGEPAAKISAMQAVIDEEKKAPRGSMASAYLSLCKIVAERKKHGS